MIRKSIAILVFFLSAYVFAGVNLKNGNFYISYTDIKIDSQHAAVDEITRTYNSKSTHVGLFGYGWGSMIETYVHAYPDGSMVVFEHGSGGKTIFNNDLITEDMIEFMIDELIEKGIEIGDIENAPNIIIQWRNKYSTNHDARRGYWDKYVRKGLLTYETDFPDGMEWESYERGNELIIKTATGFIKKDGNEIESFDNYGRLVKIDKGNGKWSKLEYSDGKLSKIINADNTEMLITINEEGFVERIEVDESISAYNYNYAVFKYIGEDLIYNRDVGGNHYRFIYDEHHNMIEVIYNPVRTKNTPKDSQYMEYEPKTMWISKITDRNGDVAEYHYDVYYKEDGTKDDDHYGTRVSRTDEYGNKNTNSYEYFIGVKETGERFSQKIITEINGIKTATTYDDLCEMPIEIIRRNRKTTFKYNNRCLLTEKISNSDSIYMKYHPKLEKLTYVKNKDGEYVFEYNDFGDLIFAQKNKDVWARLVYNDDRKITEMQQEDKTLVFKYNKIGKPIKIEIEGLGGINVTYDKYGEIERVSSEDGHEMALKVTQAFQNLLTLVKPAGVNLNM